MSPVDDITLTDRQLQVLERVAARLTLKQIASDLKVSESLVNQIISSLKKRFEVNSLSGLTQAYVDRAAPMGNDCSFSASRISALPESSVRTPSNRQDIAEAKVDHVSLHDASWRAVPPWESHLVPTPVPGMLDGKNAGLVRTALMGGIALLFFVLILVGLGAGRGLTELTARLPPPRTN